MKKLILVPDGWPCKLFECPPGIFLFNETVCFKSKYADNNGKTEVFLECGTTFWGGASTIKDRDDLIVQPLTSLWEEEPPERATNHPYSFDIGDI